MKIAVIGGTGMGELFSQAGFSVTEKIVSHTPYGKDVVYYIVKMSDSKEFIFVSRHYANYAGKQMELPHQLNHRSYMYVLGHVLKVQAIFSTSAVGAIYRGNGSWTQGSILVPNDVVDYVQDAYSFSMPGFTDPLAFHRPVDHIFCPYLRHMLYNDPNQTQPFVVLANSIKGPRFETARETHIREKDGVDVVGMPTAFPEACLAGELSVPYAVLCGISNMAPAKHNGHDVAKVMRQIQEEMKVRLLKAIERVNENGHPEDCPCRTDREWSVFDLLGDPISK